MIYAGFTLGFDGERAGAGDRIQSFVEQTNIPQLLAQLIWLQGICRPEICGQFWRQLWTVLCTKPQVLNVYLGLCTGGRHFWEYRVLARERIAEQLGYAPLTVTPQAEPQPMLVRL